MLHYLLPSLLLFAPLSAKTTLYIVRHGETDWNFHGRIHGHSDIPLNENGKEQIWELKNHMKEFTWDRCISSDLTRTYQTAHILNCDRDVAIFTDARLRERWAGCWEGKFYHEFDSALPHSLQDVETDSDFLGRIASCIDELVSTYPEQTILVTTHGGVVRYLIKHYLGLEFDYFALYPENGSYAKLVHEKGEWILEDHYKIPLEPYLGNK